MSDISKEIIKECNDFVLKNKGVKINSETNYLSPRISSELMDCSMPMTFDQYSFCSLGCTYCFAYMQKINNQSFTTKLHSVEVNNLIKLISKSDELKNKRLQEMDKHFFNKRFLLHWGGMADPFCNFEKANHVGSTLIKELAKTAYPTLFSFKGDAIFTPKVRKLFGKYSKNKSFAFQASIISPSDEMSKKIEVGVQTTSERIRAIKMLSDMGYYCILRLRPFIIGISDIGLEDMLYRCKEAGIKAISMEYMALDWRQTNSLSKRYEWIGQLIGVNDTMRYFKNLSPKERGGYMRLNRLVKEETVKIVYKFCLENDILFACSDPDYKELNMSGSCCGMPDNYPENKEMENWTKNQLTYHLKEARRLHHLKGKTSYLRFNKVYNPKEDTYLKCHEFTNDHITTANKNASTRQMLTMYDFIRDTWNNLRSPGNPRNYFNGKLLPIKADDNGNLVYKYIVSEYEDRWAKEGIDLKK